MSEIGIIMNGVSGRMGYRQHLVRSILAIRDQGGVTLSGGSRVPVVPFLVGRNEAKLAEIAARHSIADYTIDLDSALADDRWQVYSDFLVTSARSAAIRKAIAAGKAIYRPLSRMTRPSNSPAWPPPRESRTVSCTISSTSPVCAL